MSSMVKHPTEEAAVCHSILDLILRNKTIHTARVGIDSFIKINPVIRKHLARSLMHLGRQIVSLVRSPSNLTLVLLRPRLEPLSIFLVAHRDLSRQSPNTSHEVLAMHQNNIGLVDEPFDVF